MVYLCWRAIQRGGTWRDAGLIGGLLAVAGGVRQQSVPALLPVVLFTFWRFNRPRLAKLGVAAIVAVALGLAWFVPMVKMTGGLSPYLEIVRRHAAFNASATLAGGGIDALVWNIFFAALFCLSGLMLAVVPFVVTLVRRKAHPLLVVWVGAMWLMATLVGFTKQPGYVLNFLPGLLLLAAVALAPLRWPATAAVCAFNIFAFVAWPPAWDGALRETVSIIRAQFAPAETVVCHAGEYLHFGLKQFQLLLPEFDQYQLTPDPTMLTPAGQPLMAARDGRLRFVSAGDWTGKRTTVLIVPPDLTLKVFERLADIHTAQPVPGAHGLVYVMEAGRMRR